MYQSLKQEDGEACGGDVATTIDATSIGPVSARLAPDISSFVNRDVRLLKHDNSIVTENDLDKWWEEVTGEVVDEVVFLSKHTAVSNRPALTVHSIGVTHLTEDETPPAGGKPGWAGLANLRIGP
ncbi:hypothetical protein H6P81_001584 [Aristolochia fimbriata]|uniref:Uncharacterized protein n=1 Tax=Aristolochia fimbriata TaxID=158543 RepID=A0AAV7FAI3_ARIFI|nr:hypothetical protein H6P81_001584 [Aristolochia fimbriata]